MKKRIISLLLLTAMFLTLAACNNQSDDPSVTGGGDVQTSADPNENYDLPADIDFSGKTLRILSSLGWEQTNPDPGDHNVLLHDDVSNVISKAIFQRNSLVKELFSINMTEDYLPYNEAMEQVRTNYISSDDVYDIVGLVDRDMITLIGEGAIHCIDEVENVNLSKAYWNQSLNESMTIKGRQLIAYGDMNITAYDKTFALLYNKPLAETNQLGDLYELVEKGQWTWEKFYEMASQMVVNTGGGEMDEDDTYGWLAAPKQVCPTVWISGGGLSITKNADDVPEFTMDSEEMGALLDMAFALTYNNDFWYKNESNTTDIQDPPIFKENRALFTSTSLGELFGGYYSDLSFDYGIIPHPKYDKSQQEYFTRVEGGRPYGVPSIIGDTSFAGAMLEVLNCESRRIVMPEYYETCLKLRYSQDIDSGKVIDILVDSRIYDMGDTFFSNYLRDGFVMDTFMEGNPISASVIARNKNKVVSEINKIVNTVEEK